METKQEIIQGEAIEEMKKIPDDSIDAVIADIPYGTTACKWDTIIPFEPMWEQLKRITKKKGLNDSAYGVRLSSSGEYCYRQPTTLLTISNANRTNRVHPTQKPVALMEYLIKTYTNEGETVLDFTMGSGTTLVAAKQLGRNAVGIEISEKYCSIARGRLAQDLLFN